MILRRSGSKGSWWDSNASMMLGRQKILRSSIGTDKTRFGYLQLASVQAITSSLYRKPHGIRRWELKVKGGEDFNDSVGVMLWVAQTRDCQHTLLNALVLSFCKNSSISSSVGALLRKLFASSSRLFWRNYFSSWWVAKSWFHHRSPCKNRYICKLWAGCYSLIEQKVLMIFYNSLATQMWYKLWCRRLSNHK